MFNFANIICLLRVLLALYTLSLLFNRQDYSYWLAFTLTIIVIWADGLDGYLARKLKQTTRLGGILDIACDRIVEMLYWIAFAVLNWIPIWIPFLFLVRGNLVDTIRAYYQEKGFTAFGEKTMMRNPIARFLVASNFSRFSYAVSKAVAFCLLILLHTSFTWSPLASITYFFIYFATVFCVIRGLPVLLESGQLLFFVDKE